MFTAVSRAARLRASLAARGRTAAGQPSCVPRRSFCTAQGGGQSSAPPSSSGDRFWNWTTQPRPSWRESPVEAAVIFCVFGITGSTSVAVVRPLLKETIGLEGSLRDGPWSYRILSILLVSPVYACILVTVGTLAGRHTYFAGMAKKIFGRFVPASFRSQIACAPARAKTAAAASQASPGPASHTSPK
eukprot:gnl/TRDRNA2_/TRDRNA2_129620_c0_seq1.p1 gnl/TRDRNA2_/TRDRNA2_129620_c0~~gnl/TRDRNA2_/TRDRNA2_129620_c0_seq1.p1  ORF type:complete len:211 (+),score=15.36 gnl/TRDRNA2_/TRDRNA2_129620_c0_seq1:71-634(+)